MKKVHFMLTHIKGPRVANWVKMMEETIESMDPAVDNIPKVWTWFLDMFDAQFQDSTKEEKARTQLKNLKMKGNLIDKYVSDFEELVRMAGYAIGSHETMAMFLDRVNAGILRDIMKPPIPWDYQTLRQKAIESAKACQAVDDILKSRGQGRINPRPPFLPLQQQQQQPQQGQWQFFGGANRGNWCNNQFNSSNAPRNYNNAPVPMDIDRGRMNCGRGGPFRGRVVMDRQNRDQQQTNLTCFNCGRVGHFACNCPDRVRTANLLNFEESDYAPSEETSKERMNRVQIELNNMSMEGKIALGNLMKDKDSLDFPPA